MYMKKLKNFSAVDPDPEDQCVFGPSESVIICTDPDLDPDPSIHTEKKIWKPWFLLFCDFFKIFIYGNWCKCTFKK